MTRDQKATRRFLQRAALDVLQRSLSPRETRAYLDAPVRQVAVRLVQSREAMEQWLEEELYFFLLLDNFRPRTEAIEQIPRRLQKGELTVRDAVGEIMLSTGFSLRNPGNDTFVTVVLEQCLGLEVQKRRARSTLEAGKRMYDGRKVKFLGQRGQNQADIIKIVLGQEDFTRRMLDRQHRRLLGSPLPKKSEAVGRVHTDWRQFFVVLIDWIAGDAYRAQLQQRKPKSDRQFIRALYNDLLERQPNYDELRNMRNAMQSMADPAPLRSVMAKVILDSGRARLPDAIPVEPFVRTCFLRYLAREPQQQELEEFKAVMSSANARPVHVVRALVGSPEYQYY